MLAFARRSGNRPGMPGDSPSRPAPMWVFFSSTKLPMCAPSADVVLHSQARERAGVDAALQMRSARRWCTGRSRPRRRVGNPARWRPRRCGSFRRSVVWPRILRERLDNGVHADLARRLSMVTVSGFSMVTPASISSRSLRSRRMRSTSASSTRSLMPRASLGSSMRMASTAWPARLRIATMSVR